MEKYIYMKYSIVINFDNVVFHGRCLKPTVHHMFSANLLHIYFDLLLCNNMVPKLAHITTAYWMKKAWIFSWHLECRHFGVEISPNIVQQYYRNSCRDRFCWRFLSSKTNFQICFFLQQKQMTKMKSIFFVEKCTN